MTDAVIVSTARTAIGKASTGALNNTHGAEMGGHAVKHAVERAKKKEETKQVSGEEEVTLSRDQGARPDTTAEGLAGLRTVRGEVA